MMSIFEKIAHFFSTEPRFLSIVRVMPRTRAKWMIFGSVIALVGYVLPWYGVGFSPPGGSIVINGITLYSDFSSINGPQQADFTASLNAATTTALIRSVSISMVVLLFIGAVIFYLTLLRPTTRTNQIFKNVQGVVHVIPMLGYAVSLYTSLSSGVITVSSRFVKELGGTANTGKMVQYIHLYVAPGLIILLVGLMLSFVGVYIGERRIDEINAKIATGAMKERGCLDNIALAMSVLFIALIGSTLITTPIFHSLGVDSPLTSFDTFIWGTLRSLF